jgi:hypothetical protein
LNDRQWLPIVLAEYKFMEISSALEDSNLWNPLIMKVFSSYAETHDYKLFGISGDVDNLGTYVALNGRGRAENLVDLYNQYTRNYLYKWAFENSNEIVDICFIPSGEELFSLGVAKNLGPVEGLFVDINPSINKIVVGNSDLKPDDTSISFGCAIIEDYHITDYIRYMICEMQRGNMSWIFSIYLWVMERIRDLLAIEVDAVKFDDLIEGDKQKAILFRNFVYAKMLEYKYGTKVALPRIKKLIKTINDPALIEGLEKEYGLTNEKLAMLQVLLQKLDSNDEK